MLLNLTAISYHGKHNTFYSTKDALIKAIEQDDRGTHPALTVFISSLVLEQTILENLKALSSKYNLLSL